MPTLSADNDYFRLHLNGWSVGETQVWSNRGLLWLVDASKDGHWLQARAAGHAEAWQLVLEQAEKLGLL